MSTNLVESSFNSSNSRLMHLSLPKDVVTGCTKDPRDLEFGVTKHTEEQSYGAIRSYRDKEQTILQLANSINVSLSISRPIYMILNSDIMHLFLVQSVEIISGTKEIKRKEVPPDKHLLLEDSTPKKISPKATKEVKDETNLECKRRNHAPYQNRGLILSYLLKGEPPDVPAITKHQSYQGKTLSSQKRMKANLLLLGAGDLVSRSKLLQEGEYDEDIKSSSAQEQGIMRLGEGSMKLRRAKETCEQSSAQMEANTKLYNSTPTWKTHSTHLEFISKKNQSKRSSYEEDIEDATWKIFNRPDGDIRPLINSFQPNEDEPSDKTKCFGNLTQQRTEENWIHAKILYGLKVIQVQSRLNRNLPELDIRAFIGGFPPNQEELSYKPTWRVILTQPGSSSNWFHSNIYFGLRVIQFLNRRILHLPYLEAHGFNCLQTRLWRPGEISKHSGDTYNHPEESEIILQCTSIQRIRRILHYSHLPYLNAFTLEAINHQRLFHQGCCILENFNDDHNVPEKLTYPLKPSRYKGDLTSHIFPDLSHNCPTALLSLLQHAFFLV